MGKKLDEVCQVKTPAGTFEFKILDHRLTFHGICASCQAKGK